MQPSNIEKYTNSPPLRDRLFAHNGEGGIRTHGTFAGTRHFQCRPIGHSGTSPTNINPNIITATVRRTRTCLFRRAVLSVFRFLYHLPTCNGCVRTRGVKSAIHGGSPLRFPYPHLVRRRSSHYTKSETLQQRPIIVGFYSFFRLDAAPAEAQHSPRNRVVERAMRNSPAQ